jgi:hypothetical protein
MGERLDELAVQAAHLFEAPHPLSGTADQLRAIAAKVTFV